MKRLVGGLILAMSFGVQADPQIDLQNNTCHILKWVGNADDEYKKTCEGRLSETDADGAVAGYAIIKESDVALVHRIDQGGFTLNEHSNPGSYVRTSDPTISAAYNTIAVNTSCNLYNDDGTQYQINNWVIVSNSQCIGYPNRCEFETYIFCGYDIQSVIDAYYID